ncbi:MAG: hypothetical protein US40_C0012G0029 [Candidatus Roizmanbacteria bacterium GW2011_GWC2_37_13]|uniref:Uncharacterized protein n=1 Tax=Candidatus Roizmanbacteria bacterium GW2011_GWC2_37_13 TaxID=1618486 RepID=A0A0G0ILM3_9BACT|nr:MAG: hypothetical protein US38_C0008G0001 [Candidatus Roizmanbacteria bacterium GW2011_GWC1_37_12]KKQ25094.1 MAG: hypothetical protein US40_C0012G0029 [Candidatus Roizmanbacteria bacterium GW2011_GWC2_37_13]
MSEPLNLEKTSGVAKAERAVNILLGVGSLASSVINEAKLLMNHNLEITNHIVAMGLLA